MSNWTGNDSARERNRVPSRRASRRVASVTTFHPAWLELIRYCGELGHGEIANLKIQDGVPVLAEVTTKKVKFN